MVEIDIVIPAYNEEKNLEKSILKLYNWIEEHSKHKWTITIANNASTDKSAKIAKSYNGKLKYFYGDMNQMIFRIREIIIILIFQFNSCTYICTFLYPFVSSNGRISQTKPDFRAL